ncbi:asparagine synthase-related protein [Natronoglomus mannanivorans]|uniref:Asparagine synthase-related protein n=1 Tax=Natronoglomus mannanivorans TaxID=2979990 RepID=A0AAP2YZW3_9EURY|nr:asparagine synthase-related protein [Halobacteria archaeon AArc-xg1-1]
MPGTTVIESPPDRDVLEPVLESVRFDERYERHDVIDGSETLLTHTGYDQYPVDVFEFDDCTAVLEGYLYGTDDVEATVRTATEWLLEDRLERLSEWVGTRDGDFLLTVHDETDGTTWVVNDAFARLPTYRATIGETTVLTRELKVVRKLARALGEGLESDQLALGQMLLFGYPLGTRTLFDGVEQVPPGSLVTVGADETRSLHEFRFDRHANAEQSVEANAHFLRDRFVEACENRAGAGEETVVSLSGGLDSRAVIAGYTHVDEPLVAATSARVDGGNATEVDVARQVAAALDVPWSSYLADRTDRQRERLLDMTQGMNSLSMSLGLDFAEQVAADHPGAVFVTGDGGDKAIPDLTPSTSVESVDELVETIVTGQQVFSLEEVTDLVDVDADALVRSVRDRIASYPEANLEGAHVHFLVRERGINWLNHGEDRTRYHLWSTTPFYSLPFFTAAMSCPPEQKRGTHLYREFLAALSPDVLGVDYVDFGAPIDSLEYRVKRYGYEWLTDHPALKSQVLGLLGRNGGGGSDTHLSRALAEVTHEYESSAELQTEFSRSAVQRITWANGEYASEHRYLLLTLLSALAHDADSDSDSDSAGVDSPLVNASG